MKLIFMVFLCSFVFAAITPKADDPIPTKPAPEYTGVDPRLAPFVDKYKELATQHRIIFTKNVTIGIKDIPYKNVVGLCHYGDNFREVDIDRKYWESSTDRTRQTLVFHELSHCYCYRKHDYGKDQDYPEAKRSRLARKDPPTFYFISDGFFVDGCPLSYMYPYVVSDSCAEAHKDHYDNEMFDRCQPYQ